MGRDSRRGRGRGRVALVAMVGAMLACGGRALVGAANGEDPGADAGGPTPVVEAAAPESTRDASLDAGGWRPLIGEIDPTFVAGPPKGCGWRPGFADFGIAPDDTLRLTMQVPPGEQGFATCYSRLDRDGHEVIASPGDNPSRPSILGLADDESVTVNPFNGTLYVSRYDGAWGRLSREAADAGEVISSGGRVYREAAGTAVFVGSVLARIEDGGVGAVTPFPGPGGVAYSTLDRAGRVLVTNGLPDGGGGGRLVAVRPDFTLDPAFGDSGVVETSRRGHVASAPDGRIYVAIAGPTTRVLRFTSDGALDATFGSGGSIELPWNSRRGLEVTTERDGRLLVMHFDPVVDAVNAAQLSRLTPAGEIDSSFGSQGTLTLPDHCVYGGAGPLAFQSDGRLVFLCNADLMRVR